MGKHYESTARKKYNKQVYILVHIHEPCFSCHCSNHEFKRLSIWNSLYCVYTIFVSLVFVNILNNVLTLQYGISPLLGFGSQKNPPSYLQSYPTSDIVIRFLLFHVCNFSDFLCYLLQPQYWGGLLHFADLCGPQNKNKNLPENNTRNACCR